MSGGGVAAFRTTALPHYPFPSSVSLLYIGSDMDGNPPGRINLQPPPILPFRKSCSPPSDPPLRQHLHCAQVRVSTVLPRHKRTGRAHDPSSSFIDHRSASGVARRVALQPADRQATGRPGKHNTLSQSTSLPVYQPTSPPSAAARRRLPSPGRLPSAGPPAGSPAPPVAQADRCLRSRRSRSLRSRPRRRRR